LNSPQALPQCVLQSYIIGRLISADAATKMDQTTIGISLSVSTLNVIK
jgi:hypothetical protein